MPLEKIEVPFGTDVTTVPFKQKVTAKLSDGSTVELDATFRTSNPAYNKEVPGSYMFNATLDLTKFGGYVTNTKLLKATQEVVVLPKPAKEIEAVVNPAPITKLVGTKLEDLGLPTEVGVVVGNETIMVPVTWGQYYSTKVGAQPIKGTLNLPEGLANPKNLVAEVLVNLNQKAAIINAAPELKVEKEISRYVDEKSELAKIVTAADFEDGNITDKVVITLDGKTVTIDDLNKLAVGEYKLVFTITDSMGVKATKESTYKVIARADENKIFEVIKKDAKTGIAVIGMSDIIDPTWKLVVEPIKKDINNKKLYAYEIHFVDKDGKRVSLLQAKEVRVQIPLKDLKKDKLEVIYFGEKGMTYFKDFKLVDSVTVDEIDKDKSVPSVEFTVTHFSEYGIANPLVADGDDNNTPIPTEPTEQTDPTEQTNPAPSKGGKILPDTGSNFNTTLVVLGFVIVTGAVLIIRKKNK